MGWLFLDKPPTYSFRTNDFSESFLRTNPYASTYASVAGVLPTSPQVTSTTSVPSFPEEEEDAARARRVLEEAYKLSRGLSDPSTRAHASCALAVAVAREEELTYGEALFQEGLREISAASELSFDRTFCYLDGGQVARESGNAQEAIARVLAAQQALTQAPFHTDQLDVHISMDLADAYRPREKQGRPSPHLSALHV
jgi:hypothetical protein